MIQNKHIFNFSTNFSIIINTIN